jgi:hypothetical protein
LENVSCRNHFAPLGISAPLPIDVQRQSGKSENFAFTHNVVPFISINSLGDPVAGYEEDLAKRMDLNAVWIEKELGKHNSIGMGSDMLPAKDDIRAIVLLGHWWYRSLFEDIVSALRETDVPIIVIHGSGGLNDSRTKAWKTCGPFSSTRWDLLLP